MWLVDAVLKTPVLGLDTHYTVYLKEGEDGE